MGAYHICVKHTGILKIGGENSHIKPLIRHKYHAVR